MAIAFGAITTGINDSSSTLSFTSPSVSGSNTLGVVAVFNRGQTVSSVTWNGSAMTFVGGQTGVVDTDRVEIWYIIAPTAGATTVAVTLSGSSGLLRAKASYYTGTKQSAQPDASVTKRETTTSFTTTLTTVADNCWTSLTTRNVSTGSVTAGTNTTFRSSTDAFVYADNNAAITPAGSYGMTVTSAGSDEFISVMASWAPAVESGPANLKSYNTNLKANIKSIDTNLIANVKTLNTNA